MKERYLQIVQLAGNDPLKISAYEKMPLVEYYILLSEKHEENMKAVKKAAKKGK